MKSQSKHSRSRKCSIGSSDHGLLPVIGLLMVIVLCGLLWFRGRSKSISVRSSAVVVPLAIGPPIKTVAFSDGSMLSVLGIAEKQLTHGVLKPPSEVGRSSGSHTGGIGGGALKAEISMAEVDGKIVGMEFTSEPANLILETQLLDAVGGILDTDPIHWDGKLKQKASNPAQYAGWEVLSKSTAPDPTQPDLLVQLADGMGGWITGSGPHEDAKDTEQRGMIIFNAWPRWLPELEFRAMRPGLPVTTWKLVNPALVTSPESWTSTPPPAMENRPEFSLELTAVTEHRHAERPPFIHPVVKLTSKLPNLGEVVPPFKCTCISATGPWGTKSSEAWMDLPDNYVLTGFPMLPKEDKIRFEYTITATDAYPYPLQDALVLARAQVAADGKSIAVLDTTGAPKELDPIKFSDVSADGGKLEFTATIGATCKTTADGKRLETLLHWGEIIPIVVPEGASARVGKAHVGASGRSTGAEYSLDFTVGWSGPLIPGQIFSLAIATPIPASTVEFTVDRPKVFETMLPR